MSLSRRGAALGIAMGLAGCISVGSGGDAVPHASHLLHDPGAGAAPRRSQPLLPALLIQQRPADALADTASMAYSRRANEFAFYQLASWTERPTRQVPRLLQRRLEARGVAGAVGLLGEPLRGDWLLAVAIDTLHHDVAESPGVARLQLTAELFDRRSRTRLARRQFDANVPTARADSAAAAAAASQAISDCFDALVPWLEDELQRALALRP